MSKAQDRGVAVVSGGTAGVGRAVVARLVGRGYRVAVLARGAERLGELEAIYGERVRGYVCDVGQAEHVDAAAHEVERDLGPIAVWVNSAMLTSFSPFEQMTAAEFEAVVNTTFLGQVNGTRAALRAMSTAGRGRIVNVGSGLSYRGLPLQSAYCAAKHAINGFVSSVRSELLHQGSHITLSLVQLPAVNTPQFQWARNRMSHTPQPAPPIYQPDVAARAVMKAIDTGARELFVGRSVIEMVFANMFAPDLFDRMFAKRGYGMQQTDEPQAGERADNLTAPVDYPAVAEGHFSPEAERSGLVVDADVARKAAVVGGAGLFLALGWLLGAANSREHTRRD